jgi:hypothetical protein
VALNTINLKIHARPTIALIVSGMIEVYGDFEVYGV